jgi:hypothetical protein
MENPKIEIISKGQWHEIFSPDFFLNELHLRSRFRGWDDLDFFFPVCAETLEEGLFDSSDGTAH